MAHESAPDSRRLFFALWPPDDLRRRIHDFTRAAARESGGRPIPARNFHVTVLFLGQVLLPRVEAVKEAGAAVTAAAFDISLDQIESWPGSNVLCLAGSRTPPALNELADQLLFNLLAREFKLRKQVFRPHVTLARDLPSIRSTDSIDGFHWHVDELALIDSQLLPGGSRYSVLGRWSLR